MTLLGVLALLVPMLIISVSGPVAAQPTVDVGEIAQVDRLSVKTKWMRVDFASPYAEAPIVVAGPVSHNGGQPVTLRIANVTTTGFDLRLKEWPYLDGSHTYEDVSYLAIPAGVHHLDSGGVIEAGTASVPATGTTVPFAATFGDTPVLLAALVTDSGPALAIRSDVAASGFEVRLDPQEADSGSYSGIINWVAWAPGSEGGSDHGTAWEAHQVSLKHKWTAITFDRRYVKACVLADINTLNGGDPANLRFQNLTHRTVELRVDEEKSADPERAHALETIGLLTVECAQDPPVATIDFPFGATLVGVPTLLSGSAYDNYGGGVTRVGVAIRERATGDWLQPDGGFAPQLERYDADLVEYGSGTTYERDRWSYEVELAAGDYALSVRVWDDDGNVVDLAPYRHFTVSPMPTASGIILDSVGDTGRFSDIELDTAGNPVIAYFDAEFDPAFGSGVVRLIHCSDPVCAGFAGPSPVAGAAFDGEPQTSALDLEIGPDGNPIMAFNGSVARCADPDCAAPATLQQRGPGEGVSLELDAAGNPVISGGYGLTVMHCSDPGCVGDALFGPALPPNEVRWTSLALDGSGNPAVASWDWSTLSGPALTVTRCSDADCQGLASFEGVWDGYSEVDWKEVSLVLDSSNHPVIAASQQLPEENIMEAPHLIRCSNPDCSGAVSAQPISADSSAWKATALALPASDLPIVAFVDWVAGEQRDVVLAACADPWCADTPNYIVVDNGVAADWISMVIDDSGYAYLSYYDANLGDLRFARVLLP